MYQAVASLFVGMCQAFPHSLSAAQISARPPFPQTSGLLLIFRLSERVNARKGTFCVTVSHNGINGFLTRPLDLSQSCRILRSTGGMRTNSQPAAPSCWVQRTRA